MSKLLCNLLHFINSKLMVFSLPLYFIIIRQAFSPYNLRGSPEKIFPLNSKAKSLSCGVELSVFTPGMILFDNSSSIYISENSPPLTKVPAYKAWQSWLHGDPLWKDPPRLHLQHSLLCLVLIKYSQWRLCLHSNNMRSACDLCRVRKVH